MENEKVITIPAPAEQEAEPETLVKFSRPYTFEGNTYREVDLDQMDSLSAQDMVAAEKYLFKSGIISPLPDMTVGYICFIASKASGLPMEFFKGLQPKDMNRVKNKVTGFFYGED